MWNPQAFMRWQQHDYQQNLIENFWWTIRTPGFCLEWKNYAAVYEPPRWYQIRIFRYLWRKLRANMAKPT